MSDSVSWADVSQHLHGQASLATVTPDGAPHVAIVTPAHLDGSIWIGTYRTAKKAMNIASRPEVALVWSSDAEVYVWGAAELVDDLDVKRTLWDGAWGYDPAMFFGSPDHENYVLVRVTPQRAMTMRFGTDGPIQARWRA